MNYVELIKNFWLQHDDHSLTVTETALYFYLLETCNRCRWANTFNRNNSKVLADLGIASLKTLANARNRLKQAGLIDFKTRSGSAVVTYSMSIFCKSEELSASDAEKPEMAGFCPEKPGKTETSVNFTEVRAQVGAEVGEDVKEKEKKAPPAPPKKEKKKEPPKGGKKENPPPPPRGSLFPPSPVPRKPSPPPPEHPTLEAVKAYFRDRLPDWEQQAEIFFYHFSGLGWHTATGARIERWDSRANLWIIEQKQKSNGKNNRNADKAAKVRMLLDEYALHEQGGYADRGETEIPNL